MALPVVRLVGVGDLPSSVHEGESLRLTVRIAPPIPAGSSVKKIDGGVLVFDSCEGEIVGVDPPCNGETVDVLIAFAFRPGFKTRDVSYRIVDEVVTTEDRTVRIVINPVFDWYQVGQPSEVTLTVLEDPGPVRNTPAVGRPAISGTAQVGQTLMASTTGISDADGLTNAVYRYQWLRVVNDNETDIAGATVASYTVMEADVGSQLKVRVSFTDDGDHAESLTSEPTATVHPRRTPRRRVDRRSAARRRRARR